MKEKKRILFVTTANLTTNPRILKEIKLASEYYSVDFIGFKLGNWSDKIESETVKELNVLEYKYLDATRSTFIPWLLMSLVSVVCQNLFKLGFRNLFISSMASNKRSFLLFLSLLQYKKYDLVVSHNLGALYPSYFYAKKNRSRLAFDVEDYHPGELVDSDKESEKERRELMMKLLISKTSYFSFASPLIGNATFSLLKNENLKNILINNSFSKEEFRTVENNNRKSKVQFIWFSQNIDYKRGLELVIPALSRFRNRITLTLIGNLKLPFRQAYIEPNSDFINVLSPINQKDLHSSLKKYDVGLAVDLSSTDFNREIALTNKIFAYAQAGLYILATDTKAQISFLRENPILGSYYKQEISEIATGVEEIIRGIDQIRNERGKRFLEAQKFSWEEESKKLIKVWEEVL